MAFEVKQLRAMVPFGEEVKDSITGFSGVVTARFFYLNGCIQLMVTPKGLKDGKPIDDCAFDEGRLVWKGKLVKETNAERGGPAVKAPAYSRP